MQTLSPAVARRIALTAQGFADPRPSGVPTRRHLHRVLARTKLLQLDSVNVAVRAHYAPVFSRLGAYPPELLDEAAWTQNGRRPRLLVEYWAHEASLLPAEDWSLLRWRMREYATRNWPRVQAVLRRSPTLTDDVLTAVKDLGPLGAGALERALGARPKQGPGTWWNRSDTKTVCEFLFAVGELTTGTRQGFQRLYDLPERVLPPPVLAAKEPDPAEAARELVSRSAEALGIATETDLRDYYRLGVTQCRQAVADLVDAGVLEPVEVRGWRHLAYRHAQARVPRRVTARALLCPFDPLIWERSRTERLFDFHYRIEIYVPAEKRVHGYYVFPFLLDEKLVARVDLKADRAAGVLRVPGAFAEPDVDFGRVTAELGAELRTMAEWLGLDGVVVGERGDLSESLRAVLRNA
ncbi:hypothetical protein GCM10012275_06560 [Longimycelium tulufanense]|uniref:Cytoplasmic protein n=1 Tax=Longimycelium tulufanense TaxID=907463 RepID=A0A8J3FTX5_9PSEU|nr:crosslink repair DNA glycosylase YcaQ family protein [Longimycelium tulufanense]GGM38233.1 hypothetical protein GCM10012275_06560 [Longimycelium tulufanense]